MHLFFVSWFVFSYSFPFTVNVGVRHEIATRLTDAEKLVNAPGVFFPKVSLIANGRRKDVQLTTHLEAP